MSKSKGSYPYPVLGHYDDVVSTFEISNASKVSEVDFVQVRFELKSDDPDIWELLDAKKAKVMVRVSCGPTFYGAYLEPIRVRPTASGAVYELILEQEDVHGSVDLEFVVVAKEDLPCFRWTNQHEDYGVVAFDLGKGDLLGHAGTLKIDAEKAFDPMDPPIGSVFKVVPDDSISGMEIDHGQEEQVVVRVSRQISDFLNVHPDIPQVAISVIVFPALISTINFIAAEENGTGEGGYQDYEWFKVIKSKMTMEKIDADNAFKITQEILQYPAEKLTSLIEGMTDD